MVYLMGVSDVIKCEMKLIVCVMVKIGALGQFCPRLAGGVAVGSRRSVVRDVRTIWTAWVSQSVERAVRNCCIQIRLISRA